MLSSDACGQILETSTTNDYISRFVNMKVILIDL
uniref:Uncharacterized protein n=1 Tax=Arundo donax TaxID=35708 RepID=A0A0A9CKD9_ARUDO